MSIEKTSNKFSTYFFVSFPLVTFVFDNFHVLILTKHKTCYISRSTFLIYFFNSLDRKIRFFFMSKLLFSRKGFFLYFWEIAVFFFVFVFFFQDQIVKIINNKGHHEKDDKKYVENVSEVFRYGYFDAVSTAHSNGEV